MKIALLARPIAASIRTAATYLELSERTFNEIRASPEYEAQRHKIEVDLGPRCTRVMLEPLAEFIASRPATARPQPEQLRRGKEAKRAAWPPPQSPAPSDAETAE
jgi:hypothetical protein